MSNYDPTNPRIGVIYERDAHPSLKRLADLTDPNLAEAALCSWQGSLTEALDIPWPVDAHFLCYRIDADELPMGAEGKEYVLARASKKSPFVSQLEREGGRVRITFLALDYDLPKCADGAKQEWSDDGLEEFVHVLQEAVVNSKVPEPTMLYTTLHGARLLYVLKDEAAPLEAEAMLLGLVDAFAQTTIPVDGACKDWTRLFRLPSTTRQDTGVLYSPTLFLTTGPPLVNADCPTLDAGRAELYADVELYTGDMPDADECRTLLETTKNHGVSETELVKTARLYLKSTGPAPRPYPYAIIFDNEPIVRGDDNWNANVLAIVGKVIAAIARQPCASPEGVFALLFGSLEQLQHREDQGEAQTNWYTTTWDMVRRIWSSEQAKIEVEREEQAALEQVAQGVREELIEKARDEQPDEVPETPEEAVEWMSQRLIAVHGAKFHVMRPDGSYNRSPVDKTSLVPMIRDLGMAEVIHTHEVRGKATVLKNAQDILATHGIPVTFKEFNVHQETSKVDGPEGNRRLLMPLYSLNPKLVEGGRFSEPVDDWLKLLGGDNYDELTNWLAHALDYRRAICALNLSGASGAGKMLLALGLGECFHDSACNDGRVLGKWNRGLIDTPLIVCDEGVPKINSDENLSLDQAFRTLVTGGNVMIREMQTNPYSARLYPRILFTSNDMEILNEITGGRDLTEQDLIALQQRLLTIDVSTAATRHLAAKGGMSYTGNWVGSNQRYLANHILWLYENRTPSERGSDRLLVEGGTSSEALLAQRYSSTPAQIAIRSLVKIVESPGSRRGFHQHKARLWVLSAALSEFAIGHMPDGNDLTIKQASRVLVNALAMPSKLGKKSEAFVPEGMPKEGNRQRWVEVDLNGLYRAAFNDGADVPKMRELILQRIGGPELITELEG